MVLRLLLPTPVKYRRMCLDLPGWPHYQKPDGDNCEKLFNDAAKGILFDDDCQVSTIIRVKENTQGKGSYCVYVRQLEWRGYTLRELTELAHKTIEESQEGKHVFSVHKEG